MKKSLPNLANLVSESFQTKLKDRNPDNLFFTGLNGSLDAYLISYFFSEIKQKILFISSNSEKILRLKNDLNFIDENSGTEIFLSKYAEEFEKDISPVTTILKQLSSGDKYLLLLDPSSLSRRVMEEAEFKKETIIFRKNAEYNFEDTVSHLKELGYKKKLIVEEGSDYAIRGGILDIFPENLSQPIRIEFFGDIIESIREFDISTQRSISSLEEADILPVLNGSEAGSYNKKLSDYLKPESLIFIDEPDIIQSEYPEVYNEIKNFMVNYISVFPLKKSELLNDNKDINEINIVSKPQPPFNSSIKLFCENLKDLFRQNYSVFLTATDENQKLRFGELIREFIQEEEFEQINFLPDSVHSGFILPEYKLAVYTEHEVFNRYFKPKKRKPTFRGISFKDLSKVNFGDYMVHNTFGIGKYAGLRKIKVGQLTQEAVKLLYENNDSVYVNINSLHLIKKYSAGEGIKPKLNRLGGNEWEKLKQRTKKKIQDIARDLILLYSKRKSSSGFKFSGDSVWQKELEASFIYEDTPDQISATEAVKKDMETESPMDRLICGDVGFGKTEVAIRAAFKTVMDNKQVAMLVPTTILAEQHYYTFKDRLSNYAVEVEHLSRFKTRSEQKNILKRIAEGKINIIIGTHRLLSKDVRFKQGCLGLLIIDEEQRFGVKAKEQIKMLKENIDVLTLTATPIPRTLNFSLLGARDLSIINTPPKNRQPIHTEIINFDKHIIAHAVSNEIQRDGQVYFVNDKISKLDELAEFISELVPAANVGIAHGQMNSVQLEKVMMKFLEKKYNVLLCTKIIESGLDIPSVNTIIINQANNFGLAELYQLRGRVGRSNIKAYAYLITPPHSTLTRQAIRRLHALEEFTELGSGMNLALRDLEIRGAGNLLGKEQSGFIANLGFETYIQILDDAVKELKQNEFSGDFKKIFTQQKQERKEIQDVIIESGLPLLLPDSYIEDENTRLEIYQRLATVYTEDDLKSIREELSDRFGKYPAEAESLFKHIEIKYKSAGGYIGKVVIIKNKASLYLRIDDEDIFSSGFFNKVMEYLNSQSKNHIKLVQTKKDIILDVHLDGEEKLQKLIDIIDEITLRCK